MLAIVGPTASGKTEVALRLAAEVGAEIVSCDSMQVYRDFDIGTAKPSVAERKQVPHHVIDVANADEMFSAATYASLADRAIADILARGKKVLIVGGTGLYLRALRFGLMDAPPRDEALRQRMMAEEQAQPGILHQKLQSIDLPSAERIEPQDLVRVVRALEVFELTGMPLSRHHETHSPSERYPMRVAVLDPPATQLESRIRARVATMLASGLVEEARALSKRFGKVRALESVGYRQALQFLEGALSTAALGDTIAIATRQYARRQRIWFKKEPQATIYSSALALYQTEQERLR